jgi:phage major head subunit gpT-like protein
MAISEQWAELLTPGLRSIFELQASALAAASVIPQIFNVMGSTKASEGFLAMGGFSNWEEYEGAIQYDDHNQGYKTTLTHKEYVQGFPIERKLVDDDQYNVISSRPRGLALSAMRTREEHAASVFNNAFSTSYQGGDEKPLCETTHPYSPNDATTQSNELTAAISYDAVVTARQTMRAFVDDRGKLVPINPNLILVPPELEDKANESCTTMRGSNTQQPNTADYAASLVQARGISYLVWDYLTDANNWFLLDVALAKQHLLWLDRVPLEFALDPASDYNLVARYRGYMRYSYGWSDWKWVLGHNVT